jgi:hypothetical protein
MQGDAYSPIQHIDLYVDEGWNFQPMQSEKCNEFEKLE